MSLIFSSVKTAKAARTADPKLIMKMTAVSFFSCTRSRMPAFDQMLCQVRITLALMVMVDWYNDQNDCINKLTISLQYGISIQCQ